MKRRPVLLASGWFLLNVIGAFAARVAWVSENGSLAAICGMVAALVWFCDFAVILQAIGLEPKRADYLAVADRYPEKHIPQGSFKGATQKQRGLWIASRSHSVYQQKRRTS